MSTSCNIYIYMYFYILIYKYMFMHTAARMYLHMELAISRGHKEACLVVKACKCLWQPLCSVSSEQALLLGYC